MSGEGATITLKLESSFIYYDIVEYRLWLESLTSATNVQFTHKCAFTWCRSEFMRNNFRAYVY